MNTNLPALLAPLIANPLLLRLVVAAIVVALFSIFYLVAERLSKTGAPASHEIGKEAASMRSALTLSCQK
jgi:hypothetical protein